MVMYTDRRSCIELRFFPVACAILSGLLVSSVVLGGQEAQEAPPSLEDVNRELAAREAAFQNVSARITYTERARPLRDGPFKTRTQAIDATWTNQGHARADMLEEREYVPNGPLRRDRLIMTANQEEARILSWGRKRDPRAPDGVGAEPLDVTNGRILKIPAIFWAIPPNELLNLGQYWSPTNRIQEMHADSLPPKLERMDGRSTVRIDWSMEDVDPPHSGLSGSFWIAPDLGFAVVRSERSRRPNSSVSWKVIEETVCEDFIQVGELWLPRKASRKENRFWDDGEYETGTRELHAAFEGWRLNQSLDAKLFRLVFPKGTHVNDMVRGLRFKKGEIGDPEIKRLVSSARAVAAEIPPEPSGLSERLVQARESNPFAGAGLSIWVITIAGIVLAIAAIGLASRSGRWRKPISEVGK